MSDLIRKPASADKGGELTTGTQTIAGNKTFSDTVNFPNGTKGRTDGIAPSAGEIGEELIAQLTADFNTPTFAQGTWEDITGLSLNLTPGVWRMSMVGAPGRLQGTLVVGNFIGIYTSIRDSSNNIISSAGIGLKQTGGNDGFSLNVVEGMTSISTTTTYKISATAQSLGGTADSNSKDLLIKASSTYPVTFRAIRIA